MLERRLRAEMPQVVTDLDEMRRLVVEARGAGKTVGFVPTMGYFHRGHLSLMERARAENDLVVVSIFVNPTQFGPAEDFQEYPRDLERDLAMAEEAGVDIVFHPRVEDMYPQPYRTYVVVEGITETLCGAFRPGHFRGVATVVTKLFHIIPAHRAYFGAKDAQQALVIKKMVQDLNFDIEIVVCPTVREEDGLAMSSRNVYLEGAERKAATALYRSLRAAREMLERGERRSSVLLEEMRRVLDQEPLVRPEYVEIVDCVDLKPVEKVEGEVLIALAARVGRARLIDNLMVRVDEGGVALLP
ncbi:MAG: pantoate--beta-alanine ligase [Candidatus Geothermincolales bacterium]